MFNRLSATAITLTAVLLIGSSGLRADTSARTFYQLADRPLSLLDLGFYRLNLDLKDKVTPKVARLINTRPAQIGVRSYLSAAKKTDMILVIETRLKSGFENTRSPEQAKQLCEKITQEVATFYRQNTLIDYFQSFDPFTDQLPRELKGQLEEALRLSAIVPTSNSLPEVRCMRPLNATPGSALE